jgi:3-hydroxyacyl-[acyl-carrier-protein] dehydratase
LRTDNIFINEKGQFLEAGLIENMAQTAAAGTGFKAAEKQEQPPVGFIGQIKDLKIFSLPKLGDVLTTTIYQQQQVMNALLVNGVVHCNETLIAQADFKIFLQS